MTFCAGTAGAQLEFIFTLWNLETCCDYLTIYDGPNTGSPVLFNDDGSNSPGTVTSSNGCLTFVWDSDGSVVYQGWAATINCVDVPLPFDCNGGTVFLEAVGQGERRAAGAGVRAPSRSRGAQTGGVGDEGLALRGRRTNLERTRT